MQRKSNKERILDSLLESSKTTGELATELGYFDPDGTPRYKIIGRYLDTLEENGYIESKKVNLRKGRKDSKLYLIVSSIQKLSQILKEYPDLTSKMQKKDSISEDIFRKHLNLIYGLTDMEFLKSGVVESGIKIWYIMAETNSSIGSYPTLGSYPIYDSWLQDRGEHTEVPLIEKIERLFKEKLRLSPEFFRLFLTTDKNELINNIIKLIGDLDDRIYITDLKYDQDPDNWVAMYGTTFNINKIFRECGCIDIIKEYNNKESTKPIIAQNKISDVEILKLRREIIKYLNQTKKEILNAEIQQLVESLFEICGLRIAMMRYLIQTKNEKSDAETQKLKQYEKDLIFPPYFQHLITYD
jgi:hypothetical protein